MFTLIRGRRSPILTNIFFQNGLGSNHHNQLLGFNHLNQLLGYIVTVDFQYVKGSTSTPPTFTHGLDPHHFNAGRPWPQVSLAMALAVPFTAVAFASFDVPLLGPGQPLDRRPAVKSLGGYPVW